MSWLERLRSLEEKFELLGKWNCKNCKKPFCSLCSNSSQECEVWRAGDVTIAGSDKNLPPPSSATDPTRCAHCGEGECSGAMVVPFGSAMTGHTWLHSECWFEWYARGREVLPADLPGRRCRLRNGDGLDRQRVAKLLMAVRSGSRPVKAAQLGIIGEAHLGRLFRCLGCQMDTFEYKRVVTESDDFGSLPWVLEAAFGYCPDDDADDTRRLLITGVNWSASISNPFKRIGWYGDGLDAILAHQRAGPKEPVIVFLHLAHLRVEYTDRGSGTLRRGCGARRRWRAAATTGLPSRPPR